MKVLVNIGLLLYFSGVWVLSPFHQKARKMIKGRAGLLKNLKNSIPKNRKIIWFHAASLGEFEQGRPVIEAWKANRPEDFILLTFFSPSGYEIRKDYSLADKVCYLPFDFPSQINKFIKLVHPHLVVMIKYEFWPNLLLGLEKYKVPVYLISARFRPNQIFFKWYGGFFHRLLQIFSQLFVQDIESMQLLEGRGISNVRLSGDTRVDRVIEISKDKEEISGLKAFVENSFVLLGGSSWAPEEEMMSRFIRRVKKLNSEKEFKIILAPHDISEAHLMGIQNRFGHQLIRYSQWNTNQAAKGDYAVLLIDQIGLLNRLYKYADIALVGGGFGRGLHNVLEPAAYGIPVITGPKYGKFQEAVELEKLGGVFPVSNYQDFEQKLRRFMVDNKFLSAAGAASRGYVENSKGATSLIISHLMENVQHSDVDKWILTG